jgi:hypothetical protein
MSDKPLITQTLNRFDHFELRRTAMMTIKDLPSSKDLDSKAMTDVRGGLIINSQTVAKGDLQLDNNGYGFALGVQDISALSVIEAAEVNNKSYYDSPYKPEKPDYEHKW